VEGAPSVAVVTGAGSGIGRAVALAFLEAGMQVVLSGRSEDALAETARLGEGTGSPSLAVPTDVRDPLSVEQLFMQAKERFGRVDVLFNNAGVGAPPGPPDEISIADWQAVVDTNLTGAFLCTRQAFGLMRAQEPRGGRIINNGSVAAHVPRPGSAPYTATKHAITGLTRSTALDGRAYDIACSQIDIGNVATDVLMSFGTEMLQPNATLMTEPTMDVEHVARAVLYIATLPLEANVQFMTVMATKMPYIGRG
jgi:NAD(P)-dependent dehydrogenase (short-subunit alcohol dehydrogenase family)